MSVGDLGSELAAADMPGLDSAWLLVEFQIGTRQGLISIGQETTSSLSLDDEARASNASIGTQSGMPWMLSASLDLTGALPQHKNCGHAPKILTRG
ncbi:hypothetical protein WAI453_008121 [Rhynchosporium graminicola]